MFAIIGIVVVLGAVVGGYVMEHGQIKVLVQPAELIIIGGRHWHSPRRQSALHHPSHPQGRWLRPQRNPYNQAFYLNSLKMLNDLFFMARKQGLVKLEEDLENPSKSQVFSKYAGFLPNHHALAFVCDTLRTAISGGGAAFDLDQMMESDMDVHHDEASRPVTALSAVADSLPGLGIVAAVLGVVITMGALGGSPEEIGHKVAAALVGTFLGILMCYGFLGPLASNLQKIHDDETDYLRCLRHGLIAFVKGSDPMLAAEFARRSIPSGIPPSFKQFEAACRGSGAGAK